MKGGSCDLVERLAPVALREDLPGLIQQTTGGCARCARRCRPFAIAAIALAGHRRSCSPRGSRLLEGREPGNAPTVEGQDEADDMVADDPLAPVAAITDRGEAGPRTATPSASPVTRSSRLIPVAEREEPTETGLGSTARCCGRRLHRQANSVRVCSPTSRRVASLRPRSAGLTALTSAPRTARLDWLLPTMPTHTPPTCCGRRPVQNDALSSDR